MDLNSKKSYSKKIHYSSSANVIGRVRLKKKSADKKLTCISYCISNLYSLSKYYKLTNKFDSNSIYKIYFDILVYNQDKKTETWVNVNSIAESKVKQTLQFRNTDTNILIPLNGLGYVPSAYRGKSFAHMFKEMKVSDTLDITCWLMSLFFSGYYPYPIKLVDISNTFSNVSLDLDNRLDRKLLNKVKDFIDPINDYGKIDFTSHKKRFSLLYHKEIYYELLEELAETYKELVMTNSSSLSYNIFKFKPDFHLLMTNDYKPLIKNDLINKSDYWFWQLNGKHNISYISDSRELKLCNYIDSLKSYLDIKYFTETVCIDFKTNNKNILPIQEIGGIIFI